jgi:penicillin-binding protein-related factor A (putative recombinase)
MTEREQKVLDYYNRDKHAMTRQYLKEATFLKKATEFAYMLENCVVIREANPNLAGTADLILCYNGRFIACELKAMDGVASPQQLKFVEKVKKAGGLAAICTNLQDIWNLLNQTAQRP